MTDTLKGLLLIAVLLSIFIVSVIMFYEPIEPYMNKVDSIVIPPDRPKSVDSTMYYLRKINKDLDEIMKAIKK